MEVTSGQNDNKNMFYGVGREAAHEELALETVHGQPVASVDAQPIAHRLQDYTPHMYSQKRRTLTVKRTITNI